MKLGIYCNFGPGIVSGVLQTGGSEYVIENISKLLIKDYNYNVSISAFNYNKETVYNDINLIPCGKNNKLIDHINSYDHIFIYSDSFWGMSNILDNIKQIKPRITLALVGAYFLKSHPEYLKILKKNIDKFNLVVHSSLTPDYLFCKNNNLPVSIVSNGIDKKEFETNNINFREKYNIKKKYIILNIANYFYGKGQESLGLINKELKKHLKDFIIVQISSSIKYPYEERFLNRAKRNFGNDKCLFLRNIPREDVVAAFRNSDVLLNVSGKEVSPIIMLESLAAGLPFISLGVGDVFKYPGMIINTVIEDSKGYKIIDKITIEMYAKEIYLILKNDNLRNNLIKKRQEVIEKYDWKNIIHRYKGIFEK